MYTSQRFGVLVLFACLAGAGFVSPRPLQTILEKPKADSGKLKALIIDGQNNHTDWPKTTMMMRQFLEQSGMFTVDLQRTQYTWKGGKLLEEFPIDDGNQYEDLKKAKTDPDFSPNFADYDVVVSNFGYNAASWPEATQKAFEQYMAGGGGLVVVHAADNSFGDWTEFNKMIGLGGWGGRTEKTGPYVYYNDKDEEIRDTSPGKGGDHGPQHEYQIVIRDPDHPIVKGSLEPGCMPKTSCTKSFVAQPTT